MPKSFSPGKISEIASPLRTAILRCHGLSDRPLSISEVSLLLNLSIAIVAKETTALIQLGYLLQGQTGTETYLDVEFLSNLLFLLEPQTQQSPRNEKETVTNAHV